jgi:hypothetical protein
LAKVGNCKPGIKENGIILKKRFLIPRNGKSDGIIQKKVQAFYKEIINYFAIQFSLANFTRP